MLAIIQPLSFVALKQASMFEWIEICQVGVDIVVCDIAENCFFILKGEA
jgi:hypothetical protein